MLRDDIRAVTSTRRDLRNFGLVVGGAFVLLGGWALWRGKPAGPWLEGVGLILAALGALYPAVLKPLQRAWMTLAVVMGFVMTRVILGILFFGAVVPIGLAARLAGKRFLDPVGEKGAATYWRRRRDELSGPEHFDRQY